MKDLKLLFLSLLAVAAFILTGGLAQAGSSKEAIDPVKTCGGARRQTSSRLISCGMLTHITLILAMRTVWQTCLPMMAATSCCTTIVRPKHWIRWVTAPTALQTEKVEKLAEGAPP